MDLSEQTKSQSPVIIYLHGFASGVASTKARFFKGKFEEAGLTVLLPDLNVPSFEQMTLSHQLDTIKKEASQKKDAPIVLMGSSLGGLMAVIASLNLPTEIKINKLILLAPGFGIAERWPHIIGEGGMTEWQKSGFRSFFHYARGKEISLAYSFIEDFACYQTDNCEVTLPTLVFHGRDDQTVPIQKSRIFAQLNPGLVHLIELDDGHELISSKDAIWQDIERFLQIEQNNL